MGTQRTLLADVTFTDFARLAVKLGWTLNDLAAEFRGGFGGKAGDPSCESPREFFERVFAGRPSPKSVIAYRPIVEKYVRAVRYAAIGDHVRRCECGCGRPVRGRKRAATDACRKRLERARRRTGRRPPQNAINEARNAGDFL